MNRKQKKMLIRILVTSVLFVGAYGIKLNEPLTILLYLLMYLIIGYDILSKAIKGIMNRQVFDENFLMAIATVAGELPLSTPTSFPAPCTSKVTRFAASGTLFPSLSVTSTVI